jgi:hypothetical protein
MKAIVNRDYGSPDVLRFEAKTTDLGYSLGNDNPTLKTYPTSVT